MVISFGNAKVANKIQMQRQHQLKEYYSSWSAILSIHWWYQFFPANVIGGFRYLIPDTLTLYWTIRSTIIWNSHIISLFASAIISYYCTLSEVLEMSVIAGPIIWESHIIALRIIQHNVKLFWCIGYEITLTFRAVTVKFKNVKKMQLSSDTFLLC